MCIAHKPITDFIEIASLLFQALQNPAVKSIEKRSRFEDFNEGIQCLRPFEVLLALYFFMEKHYLGAFYYFY
jgi:hypothetical protein